MMPSRMEIATVIGRMNVSPAAPSGSSTVSAASGPYAAELSASRPKVGTPAAVPMRCWPASLEASRRPRIVSISDIPLLDVFSEAGKVDSSQVIIDRATNRSRGFGFVEMATDEDAEGAIKKLNGRDIKGRPIRVNEAQARTGGAGGGGGGDAGGGERRGGRDH